MTKKYPQEQKNLTSDQNEELDLKNNIDLDTFTNTYRKLIERISEKDIEVLIMSTNPVIPELLWKNKIIAQKQEESYMLYNQTAREIAENYGLIFINIWGDFIARGELNTLIQPDGVHPSETGLIFISEI